MVIPEKKWRKLYEEEKTEDFYFFANNIEMEEWMTVGDLITELLQLDPKTRIVVPDAPYGQPNPLTRIGVVIMKDDDKDTGVPAGEYIGLNIGWDLDDDNLEEENLEEVYLPKTDPILEIEKNNLDLIKENPISADNIGDFINDLEKLHNLGNL